MDSRRLLLIDHDDLLRRSLAEQLEDQGFDVAHCAGGDVADLLVANSPDLIVIEATQPEGQALCQGFRAIGFSGPILALTSDKVAGASDCLAKPFRLAVLTQRLNDLWRDPPTTLSLSGFALHPTTRMIVEPQGRQVRLTEKEVAILCYLHEAAGRIVSREELLGEVWGYSGQATTHTLETHIYRLRKKLGSDDLLVTDTGGYRLSVG